MSAPGVFLAQSITDVRLIFPPWEEVLRVLTFRAGYNSSIVVFGTTMLGVASGLVGTFALLRKRALVSDAIAHSGLPGLAAAFLLYTYFGFEGKSLPILLLGAAVSGVIAAITIQFLVGNTRLTEDTAIGAVLSVFFGIGIVMLSVIQTMQTGAAGGLHHFIYGQTAAMQVADVYLLLTITGLAILAVGLLLKEFRLICFDQQFAEVQGWPVTMIDLILMTLVVTVTVVGLQSVGLILSVALLIIPATAARFWSEKLGRVTFLSGLLGGLSAYVGASLSALLPRLPAGAVIVLSAGLIFLISFLFAPARGVFASLLRMGKLRLQVATDHLLREMFEVLEQKQQATSGAVAAEAGISLAALRAIAGWSGFWRFLVLRTLERKNYFRWNRRLNELTMEPVGLQAAERLTRNHRLWEEYLLRYGRLATSHVDYSADLVEHVLSPAIVQELEQALIAAKAKVQLRQTPKSVHPVG